VARSWGVGEQVGDDRAASPRHARRQPRRGLRHGRWSRLGDAIAAGAHGRATSTSRGGLGAAIRARDLQQLLDAWAARRRWRGCAARPRSGVAELGGGQQSPTQPQHDRAASWARGRPGQQLPALLVEGTRPAASSWLRDRGGSRHRRGLLGLRFAWESPVGILSDHSYNPGSATFAAVRRVKRHVTPLGEEVRTPSSAASSPAGAHASHPRPTEAGLRSRHGPSGTTPSRSCACRTRGRGRSNRHASCRPAAAGRFPVTPPRGPPERQWGSKVPPRICRCAVS
jgi:hypothetical protein